MRTLPFAVILFLAALQAAMAALLSFPLLLMAGLPLDYALISIISLAWVAFVIAKLRAPTVLDLRALRAANLCATVIGTLLIASGLAALIAAENSARAGGGLLGAFGYLPIVAGLLLILCACVSLYLFRRA